MKNYIITIFLLFIACNSVTAQTGWQWGRTSVYSIANETEGASVAVDLLSNVFMTGFTSAATDTVRFGTMAIPNIDHKMQTIIVKQDSNGNFLWAKGTQHSDAYSQKMATDVAGNLYVLFMFTDSMCSIDSLVLHNTSGTSYALVKFSPSGNVIWGKSIPAQHSTPSTLGSIGVDANNNIYIAGSFNVPSLSIGATTLTNINTSGTGYDAFIAKYDFSGNPVWAKRFGGSGDDYALNVASAKDGTFYVSGVFNSLSMTVGGATVTDSFPRVAGRVNDYYLARFDSAGNTIWAKAMRPHVQVKDIQANNASQLYMVAMYDSTVRLDTFTLNNARTHSYNTLIASYTPSGAVAWARSVEGRHADVGYASTFTITFDSCNNVWIAGGGVPGDTVTASGHVIPMPSGWDPAFISRYDAGGNYDTTILLSSGGDDYFGIAADYRGNFYVVGDYVFTDLIFGSDTLLNITEEAMFSAKYRYGPCSSDVSVQDNSNDKHDVRIYPNPVHDVLVLKCTEGIKNVVITDLVGHVVYSRHYASPTVEIDLRNYPTGMYLVRVNDQMVQKVIKE